MARAGIPDTRNERSDPCGCFWVYLASTPFEPQAWNRLRTCTEHKEAHDGPE
jgi:hypothetical protein